MQYNLNPGYYKFSYMNLSYFEFAVDFQYNN